MNKIKLWWSYDPHKILVLRSAYCLMACICWLQITAFETHTNNNFQIFRYAFFHLINRQPLYILYPTEHWDYYFYNPVFAFLFAPFAALPLNIGILVWLLFLAAIFFKAVKDMPFRQGFIGFFLVLCVPEVSKNLGHAQPNILNCALMLFTFISFEKDRPLLAAFLCALLFSIKGYGVIVGAMCFFYPKYWKTITYGFLFLLILSALPLSIIPFSTLVQDYKDWFNIISSNTIVEPLCLMGFVSNTLHLTNCEPYVLGCGLILLFLYWLSLVWQRTVLSFEERVIFLSFLLLWTVAFNRAAESPTYLYSVVGSLILYHFSQPKGVWLWIFGICFWGMTILPSDLSLAVLKDFDTKYFTRSLFILPLLFFAFYHGLRRIHNILT